MTSNSSLFFFLSNTSSDNAINYTDYTIDEHRDLYLVLNIPYVVMEILVAIVAVIGNLLVIIVFRREKRLRRRTNYYIVSLAIADFLVGLFGIPFAILTSIGLPNNQFLCLFTLSSLIVLCTISIFCLVAVSIDRYWAILHPLAYSRNVRTKTAIGIISICWLIGSIIGFMPLFGWASYDMSEGCLFTRIMDYNYLVFLCFATIITPAIILAVFYGLIYRVILKQINKTSTSSFKIAPTNGPQERYKSTSITPSHHSTHTNNNAIATYTPSTNTQINDNHIFRLLNSAAQKREVKATQNLSIIVCFFMICWIPLYTINTINAFCRECFIHPTLTFCCIILSHVNSAINPVLYAYHLKDFRGALLRLFRLQKPQDHLYRPSINSQHQQNKYSLPAYSSRQAIQQRTYIDSPVWKRQQLNPIDNNDQYPLATLSNPTGSNQNEECDSGFIGTWTTELSSNNDANNQINKDPVTTHMEISIPKIFIINTSMTTDNSENTELKTFTYSRNSRKSYSFKQST